MGRNDRREEEVRGGLGTLTRSQPGPRPRSREVQAQAAGAEVAAPAPRRGRQARGVPPQRDLDSQQATPVRRPPAESPADAARAADPRGTRQPGADSRRAGSRRGDLPGADSRRAGSRRGDQPGADSRRANSRRGNQSAADTRRADKPSADPRRADQPSADPRLAGSRTRAQRNAAVLDRQGAPARTGGPRPADQAPPRGAPWRAVPARRGAGPQAVPKQVPRQDRGAGPQPADAAVREPRAFLPGQPDLAAPTTPAQATEQPAAGSHRMPFVLLLCGLLGGALISALVISTTLAEGSFKIIRLQNSTSSLAKQRQALEQQVAEAKSAQVIAERASKLGMRPAGLIQYIDLKTGKTLSDHNTGALAHAQYPGYTP